MEYQKIINLFRGTTNKPSKFRRRNWVEINDESRGTYGDDDINYNNNDDDNNNNSKFKILMIRSNLRGYSDAFIIVKGTVTVSDTSAQGVAINNTHKKKNLQIVLHLLAASPKWIIQK